MLMKRKYRLEDIRRSNEAKAKARMAALAETYKANHLVPPPPEECPQPPPITLDDVKEHGI